MDFQKQFHENWKICISYNISRDTFPRRLGKFPLALESVKIHSSMAYVVDLCGGDT